MLESEKRKAAVVDGLVVVCPVCQPKAVTMAACAIGSATVHQEYTCDSCSFEFTSLFTLMGFYEGHPDR